MSSKGPPILKLHFGLDFLESNSVQETIIGGVGSFSLT